MGGGEGGRRGWRGGWGWVGVPTRKARTGLGTVFLTFVPFCRVLCISEVMSRGLFDEALEAAAPTEEQASRRTKLYPWDSVASQLFEPYGECISNKLSLPEIWKAAKKGSSKAQYHSHLCADASADPWHVGAGMSLTDFGLRVEG